MHVNGFNLEWLNEVYDLDKTNRAGYLILENIDNLFLAGRFEEADTCLRVVDTTRLGTYTISSFLTFTKVAEDRLPSRADFVRRAEERYREIAPDRVERLMKGLR